MKASIVGGPSNTGDSMRLVFSASIFLFAGSLTGCGIDNGLRKEVEEGGNLAVIDVSPETLTYADVAMGDSEAKVFTVSSVGSVDLEVSGITLDTGAAFAWASMDGKLPGTLAVGESADITVTYTRASDGEFDTAWVASNDTDNPNVGVLLYGGDVAPELTLDPPSWDAGAIGAGDVVTGIIKLKSTGGAPVVINELSIDGDSEFTIVDSGFSSYPATLAPGEESSVKLSFSPSDIDVYNADLVVDAAAPVGTVTAPLTGEGAGGPIAMCYADPAEVDAISGTTTFMGDDSYDTGSATITTYTWTLISAPSGSAALLARGSGPNRTFQPDLVGDYTAQLIVTNNLGQSSEPCEATVSAIPTQDFWIEMYWVHSGDDMDLHLLKPAGSRESSGDCYFANCTYGGLDWGVRGDSVDDPSLDLDDISAVGPENINIDAPANGDYTVEVHDYPGSVYNGRNDVTVNIYVGGALVWSDTRDVNSEGSYESFATVTWPGGSVTPM